MNTIFTKRIIVEQYIINCIRVLLIIIVVTEIMIYVKITVVIDDFVLFEPSNCAYYLYIDNVH
jgi:hypothetical protein